MRIDIGQVYVNIIQQLAKHITQDIQLSRVKQLIDSVNILEMFDMLRYFFIQLIESGLGKLIIHKEFTIR